MKRREAIPHLLGLTCLALFLFACASSTTTPAPPTTSVSAETAIAATLTSVAIESAVATTLTAAAVAPPPTAPPSAVPPTLANTSSPILTPNTPVPSAKCTVVAQSLNLGSGPGVVYQPPLTVLPQGTELAPLAYSPIGFPGEQWLQVQVPSTNQTGWVNAGAQYITCNIDVTTLPAPAALPPTPTPTLTPTPIPAQPTFTPTPTPPSPVAFEPPGGGNDDVQGYVEFPGFPQGSLDPDNLVFHDKLVFRVVTFDQDEGQTDGAGIDNVYFEIFGDQGMVHERTEQTVGYCVFGGGEPNCSVWNFAEHNYRWPEPHQDQLITNGNYTVQITINPTSGDSANWNFDFRIEGALEQQPDQPSNLIAQIVQTGPNSDADVVSDALVFQVFASADGVNDGAGIDRVDLQIIGPNGEVHQRTEQTAHFCAFSGGEPDCNVWDFAENGYQWPNGDPIEPGDYTLRATVYAEDGNSTTVEMTVQIQ